MSHIPETEQLLKSDQELYVMIAQGDRLLQQMFVKRDAGILNAFQQLKIISFEQDLFELKQRWMNRQDKLQRAATGKDSTFFGLDSTSYTDTLKKKLISLFAWGVNQGGLGLLPIIPILIKAAIWIVTILSATAVADMLTTSADEKEDLLATSQKLCADLNLTGAQCKDLIKDVLPDKGSGFGPFVGGGVVAIGLAVLAIWQGPKLIKALK